MEEAAGILKRGARRSVRIESREGREVVVKRFEDRGLAGRAFDAGRARREFELLAHLAGAGVDVPRPLKLGRDGRAHELELERIAGARTLAEELELGSRPPARVARALGALLAALHGARVDHRDLHAGNVLVTGAGRAVAIDFGRAKIAGPLTRARAERDLAALGASVRERTSARWRALVLAAWWDALDPALRARIQEPDALLLERLARARRLRTVRERERRWLAGGTAVEPLPRGRGVARHGLDPARVERALEGADGAGSWIRVAGARREVLALWKSMARLEEHAVGAPRCRVLLFARPAAAWFEPEGPRSAGSPASRGRLVGALLDRGLWLDGLSPESPESIGEGGLLSPLSVAKLRRGSERAVLASWLAPLAGSARAAFLRGVREAWRGPARELAELSRAAT